jgi:hypothetical protein
MLEALARLKSLLGIVGQDDEHARLAEVHGFLPGIKRVFAARHSNRNGPVVRLTG